MSIEDDAERIIDEAVALVRLRHDVDLWNFAAARDALDDAAAKAAIAVTEMVEALQAVDDSALLEMDVHWDDPPIDRVHTRTRR